MLSTKALKKRIVRFLRVVDSTVRHPPPQAESSPISEKVGLKDLSRYMRGFGCSDKTACRGRNDNLLNTNQSHTKDAASTASNTGDGSGFLRPATTTSSSGRTLSWEPPDRTRRRLASYCDVAQRFAARRLIVDTGSAHRYRVKYASKGDSRNR